LELRRLLTNFTVTTTNDGGPGSLREAILMSDMPHTGADIIDFVIPASTPSLPSVPLPGFDPRTQDWTITLQSALPPITHQVTIDGYTQGVISPISYLYPKSPTGLPTEIASTPNSFPGTAPTAAGSALNGNNAVPRVIVDGSMTGGATGFVLDTSDSILRGLIINGFGVGVSVPNSDDVGDLIQGDDIGKYPIFPVDPESGVPVLINGIQEEDVVGVGDSPQGLGNSLQGVLLGSTNATVGGLEAQDNNVIIGNGFSLVNGVVTNNSLQGQGVSILPGAQGNQVIGNQIGIIGPAVSKGPSFIVPNGSDGVLIADSSNYVGGAAAGAGNLISGNLGDGVHIVGPAATRINVLGNYIGIGPGGEFVLGSADPGNLGDGVQIENASDNVIGGVATADRNVISGNGGAGVRIFGPSGVRDIVLGNYIGITVDGISALGNSQEGVAISSADNVVGPGNVISANLRGILFVGAGATGNLAQGNLIGTNSAGTADLGNAQEGVLINGASGNSITGNAQGSQVISGNNVGLLILGSEAAGNLVQGTFFGTDVTGTLDLGNSQAGVEIEDAPVNLIGGSTASDRNLISANYWGVQIIGPLAVGNVVEGSFIGTEITGQKPLGNEQDGVLINQGATDNLIGGPMPSDGNTIAFNRRDGVRIEDLSVGNSILSNSIFANLEQGINLVPLAPTATTGPNMLASSPILTEVASSIAATIITGMLVSTPNTTFTIQFFFSSPLDPTGVGEGGVFVGQTTAVTGANGVANYSANIPVVLKSGQLVTATATDSFGNTSEFSSPITEVFGTVQFQMASYTVSEGVGTATIVATRSGGSGGFFTVNYATANGTGLAGSAYQPAMGTLTFQPGENSQTFTVTILDNGQPEGDVTVLLGLSNPMGPVTLGTQSTAVLTILGNQPGAFQFQMSDFTVDEAAATATITVTRNQPGLTSTVNYSTADGTAIAGIDYLPASGTLTFNPGVLSQTFTIPILINPLIKGNETVLLNLSSPSPNASLGSPSSAVLVIIDDGIDRMGPHVTSVKAVSGPLGVAELVVAFDEPLDPATAVDLLNYGYSVRTAGHDGKLGTRDDRLVGISSATYNPVTMTVTLPLGFAVPNQTKLLLMINAATDVPGAGVGVSDLEGNLLDGNDDGHPGGSFSATVVAQPVPKPVKVTVAKSSKPKAKPAKHPVKVTPAKSQPHSKSTSKGKTSAHH
jgi:Calx-beta domain